MTTTAGSKRKAAEAEEMERHAKRVKVMVDKSTSVPADPPPPPSNTADSEDVTTSEQPQAVESEKARGNKRAREEEDQQEEQPKVSYRKLAPPRPFPTVPTSVSATGPRSAHVEGKNYICITRKTPLGAYLRRCKDMVLKDGHKTLHLSAMGAAIPHLMQLAVSLPEILPHGPEEIHTEVLTGSVDLQDEVIPEDEEEDISYRTRGKSTVSVVITIGDGIDQGSRTGKGMKKTSKGPLQVTAANNNRNKGHKQKQRTPGGRGSGKTSDDRGKVVVRMEDLEEN
ncbi:hypothetical protein NM688_g8510 [Phlebia brevispora]|uniref:Uncharacterized protein n=1 Tax=Phlebia brevispora TaxID=194682 RepID=A0ACC1RSP2_9APHY|nr:hypothetical protein NM688_g8510 [Phlebia brevispora]